MDPTGSGLLLWDALVNSWFHKRLRISNQVATNFSRTLPPELLILPPIENYGIKKYFTNFFVPQLLENLVSLNYLKLLTFLLNSNAVLKMPNKIYIYIYIYIKLTFLIE